ncbi:hypothetical protein HPB49_012313 [Dermacentor silvarum]|uniref:Uncharacterized protein n=1 Tax=Dermacentor silvarum TaxID=543639 RepID=A0ACB8CEY6_DERSI|nr:hypothetical protein HPB49_012313 [Dermacentor silvarum]
MPRQRREKTDDQIAAEKRRRADARRLKRAQETSEQRAERLAQDLDTVLDKLSRCHVVIFVFAFLRGLPVTWNMMMPVFVSPSAVEFRCAEALNGTVATASGGGRQIWANSTAQCFTLDGTNASKPCESWVYDRSVYGKTVTEECNMVCSNRWMVSSSQSIYLAGVVVGTVAASHISDWYGRKRTILGAIVLSLGASVTTAFSTSATMYYILRFVVAMGVSGFADVIYTLIMETVSPRFRYMPTMTLDNGWTTGMLLLPWLHYLTREWRATQLYAALPLAPLLVLGCQAGNYLGTPAMPGGVPVLHLASSSLLPAPGYTVPPVLLTTKPAVPGITMPACC